MLPESMVSGYACKLLLLLAPPSYVQIRIGGKNSDADPRKTFGAIKMNSGPGSGALTNRFLIRFIFSEVGPHTVRCNVDPDPVPASAPLGIQIQEASFNANPDPHNCLCSQLKTTTRRNKNWIFGVSVFIMWALSDEPECYGAGRPRAWPWSPGILTGWTSTTSGREPRPSASKDRLRDTRKKCVSIPVPGFL